MEKKTFPHTCNENIVYASDTFFFKFFNITSKRIHLIGLLHGCSSGLYMVVFGSFFLLFVYFFCINIILLIIFPLFLFVKPVN